MMKTTPLPPDDPPPDSYPSLDDIARDLLGPLWRGISSDYKSKYMRNIWEQFENNICSAAYTARLPNFMQHMRRRLGLIPRAEDLDALHPILHCGQAEAGLAALRRGTAHLGRPARSEHAERTAKRGYPGE